MEFWIRFEIVPGEGVLGPGPPAADLQVTPSTPPTGPQLIGITEAAEYLGLSRSALYDALHTGRIGLSPVRVGRVMKLSKAQLDAWLAEPRWHKPVADHLFEVSTRRGKPKRQVASSSSETDAARRFRVPRAPGAGAG